MNNHSMGDNILDVNGTVSVTSWTGNTHNVGMYFPSDIYNYYHCYGYPIYIPEKSKVDQAFKIIKVLIDKKLIREDIMTVAKFIETVNELAKEL